MEGIVTDSFKELIKAAHTIARMRSPSVESVLKAAGYTYEADCVAALVRAVDKLKRSGRSTLER